MIKNFLGGACLLLSLVSFAQEGTSSPYSFYGIGDVRFKGALEYRSMAGVAVEQDSIHMNLQNPASYSSLKLTTFTLGGTYASTTLKNSTESANASRTTVDYLAFGLPMGKLGVGFGLIPYSSVGYKINSEAQDATENNRRFNGTGGLNKVFLGAGYQVTPKFSVGADANYNFGKIETSSLEFINGVPLGTIEQNSADLSGVNFNLGMMYQTKIYKKITLYSSLTYSLESTLNSKNTRNIATVIFDPDFNLSVVDALDDVNSEVNLTIPSKIALSGGIGEARKWLVGGKIAYGKTSGQANNYNDQANVGYGKYGSVSLGGYFIPNYNSFTSYAKRIVYRAGLRYEKTGLVINSESINDRGMTFGLGLPIYGTLSNVNFGLELGTRGTTKANLVQENYVNASVSFSLNDKWFEKRKFN